METPEEIKELTLEELKAENEALKKINAIESPAKEEVPSKEDRTFTLKNKKYVIIPQVAVFWKARKWPTDKLAKATEEHKELSQTILVQKGEVK